MGNLYLHCLILLCLLVTRSSGLTDSSEVNPSSITFSKSDEMLHTESVVYHMELDLYKDDGSIIYGASGSLQTTDWQTVSFVVTLPNALITSFTQVNSTHIALVTHENHSNCLKILNRQNNMLQTLAGSCGATSYFKGRVSWPRVIVVDARQPDRLLVTDWSDHSLKSVDLHTGEVGTVARSGFKYPGGMLWVNSKLLVTNQHYISEVNWLNNGTVTNTIIAGSTSSGDVDGSLSDSRFRHPLDLLEVGDGLILVADQINMKLRLLNMNTGVVGPVCTNGVLPCTNGTQLELFPYSLLKVNNEVYVGGIGGVYRYSESDLYQSALCPYNNLMVYVSPEQKKAEVRLHCGNIAVLSLGVHQFKREHNSFTCSYYVQVISSQVIRTLVFKAEYETSCSSVSDNNTQEVLRAVLLQREKQFQSICIEDCAMSSTKQPWFVCDDNLLTVYWPTDNVYSVDVVTPPPALTDLLKERLQETPEMCTDIFIISETSPLVEAKKNSEEKSVHIALYSSCYNSDLTYIADQDTCV